MVCSLCLLLAITYRIKEIVDAMHGNNNEFTFRYVYNGQAGCGKSFIMLNRAYEMITDV